jgi:hypothetical protein
VDGEQRQKENEQQSSSCGEAVVVHALVLPDCRAGTARRLAPPEVYLLVPIDWK